MEVLTIAMDNNEDDTSQEEYEEEDYLQENTHIPIPGDRDEETRSKRVKMRNKYENRKLCYDFGTEFIEKLKRPRINDSEKNFTSSSLVVQPESFRFLMMDCVSTVSDERHPNIKINKDILSNPKHLVMRLFGVTQQGYSVCCNVHGYLPYFYALPSNNFTESNVQHFQNMLNRSVKEEVLKNSDSDDETESTSESKYKSAVRDLVLIHPTIVSVEILDLTQVKNIWQLHVSTLKNLNKKPDSERQDSMEMDENETSILKISCALPKFVWAAAKILSSGCICYPFTSNPCSYELYEANINNNIQFLTDRNIPGCSWLEISAEKYFIRNENDDMGPVQESTVQLEVDVLFTDIIKVSDSENVYEEIPPLRILSFDLEVLTYAGDSVPRDGEKPILQIGNTIGTYGSDDPLTKVIFTLNDCDAIDGTTIFSFVPKDLPKNIANEYRDQENAVLKAEAEMLSAWRDFVIMLDPDIITGYNIKNFDIPYLIDRAEVIGQPVAKILPYECGPWAELNILCTYFTLPVIRFLGRMKNIRTVLREVQNPLKGMGTFDKKTVNIQGRVIFDMLRLLFRHDRNGRGFKLKQIAKRHLNHEEKGDVEYGEIAELQTGNSTTRKKLAVYCVQDAYLAHLLLLIPVPQAPNRGNFVEFYVNKSCFCGGTLLRYLLNKSTYYNQYYKQVRVQKNPDTVIYYPDTPSPKKHSREKLSQQSQSTEEELHIKVRRNLFDSTRSSPMKRDL